MPLEQSGTDPQVKNALATAWKHEKSVSARTEMVTLISGGGESAGRRRRATFAGPARPATESVDEAFRHLRGRGLDLEAPTVAHYGMKQLFLRDPDGYAICFQWRASQG